MDQVAALITVTGAAGALYIVLKWIVDGKLHGDSEVRGLREDKRALLAANRELGGAVAEANKAISSMLPVVTEILTLLKEEDDLKEEHT